MNMLTTTKVLTMSSAELAELLKMERKEVNRKIREMFHQEIEGGIISPAYRPNGQVEYYTLPEIESTMFVGKWHTPFLRKLAEFWVWRKEADKPKLPQTFAEALQLAADQAKLIEEKTKELEIAKPKVEFVDRFCISEGNKTFRQVAKILKANEREFRDFLVKNKIMYKLGGKWMAYQNHLDAKRFHVSTGVADNEHAFTNCKFTPKGIEYVAGKWMARDL